MSRVRDLELLSSHFLPRGHPIYDLFYAVKRVEQSLPPERRIATQMIGHVRAGRRNILRTLAVPLPEIQERPNLMIIRGRLYQRQRRGFFDQVLRRAHYQNISYEDIDNESRNIIKDKLRNALINLFDIVVQDGLDATIDMMSEVSSCVREDEDLARIIGGIKTRYVEKITPENEQSYGNHFDFLKYIDFLRERDEMFLFLKYFDEKGRSKAHALKIISDYVGYHNQIEGGPCCYPLDVVLQQRSPYYLEELLKFPKFIEMMQSENLEMQQAKQDNLEILRRYRRYLERNLSENRGTGLPYQLFMTRSFLEKYRDRDDVVASQDVSHLDFPGDIVGDQGISWKATPNPQSAHQEGRKAPISPLAKGSLVAIPPVPSPILDQSSPQALLSATQATSWRF